MVRVPLGQHCRSGLLKRKRFDLAGCAVIPLLKRPLGRVPYQFNPVLIRLRPSTWKQAASTKHQMET